MGWQFLNQDSCNESHKLSFFKGFWALLCRTCWPYRSVEVALAVHGNVEPCLGALDGHYPEPHRNQVELHCKIKQRGEKRALERSFFLLNAHSASSKHKKTIAFQLSPISSSRVLQYVRLRREYGSVWKRREGEAGKGLGEGDLGGMKCGCRYTGGQTKTGVTVWRIPPAGEREIERAGLSRELSEYSTLERDISWACSEFISSVPTQ